MHAVLCCAVLCYVVLCSAVVRCGEVCCDVMWCDGVCSAVMCCARLCHPADVFSAICTRNPYHDMHQPPHPTKISFSAPALLHLHFYYIRHNQTFTFHLLSFLEYCAACTGRQIVHVASHPWPRLSGGGQRGHFYKQGGPGASVQQTVAVVAKVLQSAQGLHRGLRVKFCKSRSPGS